jgi:hypothetical protein
VAKIELGHRHSARDTSPECPQMSSNQRASRLRPRDDGSGACFVGVGQAVVPSVATSPARPNNTGSVPLIPDHELLATPVTGNEIALHVHTHGENPSEEKSCSPRQNGQASLAEDVLLGSLVRLSGGRTTRRDHHLLIVQPKACGVLYGPGSRGQVTMTARPAGAACRPVAAGSGPRATAAP